VHTATGLKQPARGTGLAGFPFPSIGETRSGTQKKLFVERVFKAVIFVTIVSFIKTLLTLSYL
jgi:hypothetical protein